MTMNPPDIQTDGYYGMIKIDNDAAAVAIYNDEQIEQRADTPQLEFPDLPQETDENDILKQKVGAIHRFFERLGETAIGLFTPLKDDLDGIIILGSSPMKFHFDEGGYLEELDDMVTVANAGPLEEHPLSEHIDEDNTIAEQLTNSPQDNK